MPERVRADLVLVGGGHAHVQVLRRFLMRPPPGARVTVVLDRPEAVYSGMVPGFVAGDYRAHELEIDVVPLARRARARVVLAPALRVDPRARRIELEGRAPLAYDVASLDVGGSVRGLELPGVRAHALATRPIRAFVDRLEGALEARGSPTRAVRLVVVGGGAAGLEIAFTLDARLRAEGRRAELLVVCDSPDVLPGTPSGFARRARREAQRRGIGLRCGARVAAVEKDALFLDGEGEGAGEELPCDLAIWATGAAPTELLAASPLPLDARGFVRVAPTLEVVGADALFAAGDCAAIEGHAWVPKAGVYAVREGPVLTANLRARLAGTALRPYRPQRGFLTLLNLGEGRALGAKWRMSFAGRSVWRLKDWIDRRFVRRFAVLTPGGDPAPGFPSAASMGMEEMSCGGCAAKLGAPSLERALARLGPPRADAAVRLGLERPDDAAALALPRGDLLLASVDGFRAFTEDPWLVGRVAAVNAASDVFAKGGTPRHALALVGVPEEETVRAEETLFQVLAGIRAAFDPLGITLVGGHTTRDDELRVSLAVTGDLASEAELLRIDSLRAGETLLLTKALGTGVLLAAHMRGEARGVWVQRVVAALCRSNAEAARAARRAGARACTDVSGFGLALHLRAMCQAGGVAARIRADALPALDGALPLLVRGVRSTFHAQNAALRDALRVDPALATDPRLELCFDPQTSGGLLFGVTPERAEETVGALREAGDSEAAAIGVVTEAKPGEAILHVAAPGEE